MNVKNFVVYSLTEFQMSPSLNMVIAPNGTGKSTLVCAVCLGLAGSPALLGRQKTLAGFIKNGEESATIEITLKNKGDERDVVITRDIYQNNKSDWYLNNKPTSETKVKAELEQLNVQLDNLCQFLPQEKVASFAALDQKELLLETQRAVDNKLYQQHKELIAFDDLKREIDAKLTEALNEKARLEVEQARYEEDAKKYEAHQNKQIEIKLHTDLLSFARLEDLKVQTAELKAKRDEIKARLDSYEDDIAPFEDAKADVEKELQKAANESYDKRNVIKTYETKLKESENVIEKVDDKIEKLKNTNRKLEERAAEKKAELEKSTQILELAKEEFAGLEVVDDKELKDASNETARIHDTIIEFDNRIDDLREQVADKKRTIRSCQQAVERHKAELNSNDKIQVFDMDSMRKNRGAVEVKKAVKLLRSELRGLRNEIFEPPCLTVTAKSPSYADYLEELVPFQTSISLTAISKEAYDKHSPEFIEKRNIHVPFRYLSSKMSSAKFSLEQLKQFGFDGYLSDFLDGPMPVIHMLSDIAYINDVPVAVNPLGDRELDALCNPRNGQIVFKKFFSGDTLYTLAKSQYGSRQVTTRTTHVSKAQIYGDGGISEEARRRIHEQIKKANDTAQNMEHELAVLKANIESVTQEKEEIKGNFNHYRAIEGSLKEKKKKREKAEARISLIEKKVDILKTESNKDHKLEIEKNRQRIKVLEVARIDSLCDIADTQCILAKAAREVAITDVRKIEANSKRLALETLFKSILEGKEKLKAELAHAKRELQRLKDDPERQELKARIVNLDVETKESLIDLIQKYREERTFTEEAVRLTLERLQSELTLLGSSSRSSIKALERVVNQLKELDAKIPEYQGTKELENKKIREILSVWEPQLNNMVQRISTKFSTIFPTVGSAGEIRVTRAERFSDWKLEIMVKFRDEADLKPLDSHTQSGGERAVSTVYFMISMQELTSSPFRVVDEINQGMDTRNERVVHKHMVEVACKEQTSQYFLITPKLLTNLHYAENMRVHCIMSGPWTPNPFTHPKLLTLGATSLYD